MNRVEQLRLAWLKAEHAAEEATRIADDAASVAYNTYRLAWLEAERSK